MERLLGAHALRLAEAGAPASQRHLAEAQVPRPRLGLPSAFALAALVSPTFAPPSPPSPPPPSPPPPSPPLQVVAAEARLRKLQLRHTLLSEGVPVSPACSLSSLAASSASAFARHQQPPGSPALSTTSHASELVAEQRRHLEQRQRVATARALHSVWQGPPPRPPWTI